MQQVRAGSEESGGTSVGMEFLVTDSEGKRLDCNRGSLTVGVRVSSDGGKTFTKLEDKALKVSCDKHAARELAVVVDNSGSEDGFLADLKTATRSLVGSTLKEKGRASLVRVSTEAQLARPLTDDAKALDSGVDEFFVSNGWTAFYDGVRLGNESLGVAAQAALPVDKSASFCAESPRRGIVVFTDGRENNSSDEHNTDYPGDGIDTTLEDLHKLQVGGVTTPIYTVGLGDEVDHDGLAKLAAETGGRHKRINDPGELSNVFNTISDYFGPSYQVCGALPKGQCGRLDVQLDYTWSGSEEISGTREYSIDVQCPDPPKDGRVVTMLLALSNPGISRAQAAQLAQNSVSYVSPVEAPRVLIVKDDNHHNETQDDPQFVRDLLLKAGVDATLIEEPADGLVLSDLSDYDVVWFSNPGYPMDDEGSFKALQAFSAQQGGVVLQGDDMGWSWGGNFSTSPLTHLEFLHNGTSACGVTTDGNGGANYKVALEAKHAVLNGLTGQSFLYGDDIDNTRAMNNGEQVLATADIWEKNGKKQVCKDRVPVIVAFEPPAKAK